MTCWVSAAFSDSETNVSLTLSLHKKFEVRREIYSILYASICCRLQLSIIDDDLYVTEIEESFCN